MNEFLVRAGWIFGDPVIGRCRINRDRGNEVISFKYNAEWLDKHPSFVLGPDVFNTAGWQYPEHSVFGFLEDCSPDRWGRRLLDRALSGGVSAHRTLMASDYLLGVSDEGRMGGLRLSDTDGVYLASSDKRSIPVITDIRRLQDAVEKFERNVPASDPYLSELCDPGSSLGGARPKANVYDTDGSLWLAKFPSEKDEYDIGAFEMLTHELAEACGILVSPAKTIYIKDKGTIYLTKRFDRLPDGRRVHFASAMNMLGETDNSKHVSSYLDIAEVIERYGSDAKANLFELWKRLAFGVCVGNADDHLRNHGFLYINDKPVLSPAYDINPNPFAKELKLMIDYDSCEINIQTVFNVAEFFRVDEKTAHDTIQAIQETIKTQLGYLRKKYNISASDFSFMSEAFRETYHAIGCGLEEDPEDHPE